MAERKNADHGLVDAWTASLGGPRTAALLDRLDKAVAWQALVKPIAALPEYRGPTKGENKGGRPAWPALTMLKCVLLAKWFGLSDPQLEECLQDRLSFRRFVGLALNDSTPDETTFVRFRTRLREANLDRVIFDATKAELDRRGLLVKDGSLIETRDAGGGKPFVEYYNWNVDPGEMDGEPRLNNSTQKQRFREMSDVLDRVKDCAGSDCP